MNACEIFLVAALGDNGVIGAAGALPWQLPADLRHFKTLTMGKPMVMGRKTFDSLPGLLPGRRHIVLTRDPDWAEEGAEPVHSVGEALALANAPHVAVVGGAQIYALFLPFAHRLELTRVHAAPQGDARFPAFDPAAWQESIRESHPAAGATPGFDFITLLRKHSAP